MLRERFNCKVCTCSHINSHLDPSHRPRANTEDDYDFQLVVFGSTGTLWTISGQFEKRYFHTHLASSATLLIYSSSPFTTPLIEKSPFRFQHGSSSLDLYKDTHSWAAAEHVFALKVELFWCQFHFLCLTLAWSLKVDHDELFASYRWCWILDPNELRNYCISSEASGPAANSIFNFDVPSIFRNSEMHEDFIFTTLVFEIPVL